MFQIGIRTGLNTNEKLKAYPVHLEESILSKEIDKKADKLSGKHIYNIRKNLQSELDNLYKNIKTLPTAFLTKSQDRDRSISSMMHLM